jgi:hypothetical protein
MTLLLRRLLFARLRPEGIQGFAGFEGFIQAGAQKIAATSTLPLPAKVLRATP